MARSVAGQPTLAASTGAGVAGSVAAGAAAAEQTSVVPADAETTEAGHVDEGEREQEGEGMERRRLVDTGDLRGLLPIMVAIYRGNKDCVQVLLGHNPTLDALQTQVFAYEQRHPYRAMEKRSVQSLYAVTLNPNDLYRVNLSLDSLEVYNGTDDFGSARANTGVYRQEGRWYFEVELLTGGLAQLGWATRQSSFNKSTGVGDTGSSFGFDGFRCRAWHDLKSSPYGQRWKAGDIVGCELDRSNDQISFYLNGQPMGVAFAKIGDDIKLFPAVSVDATERCRLNFGGRGGEGFRHLPDGCKSLCDLIPEAQARLTHWKLRALHGTFVSEPAMKLPCMNLGQQRLKLPLAWATVYGGAGAEMFDLLLREASPQAVAGQLRLLAADGAEQGLMPVPHLASLCGNEAVLRWCVEHSKILGAKGRAQAKPQQQQQLLFDLANDRDRVGATALHYAALGGHLACVRLLVEEAHVPPDTTIKKSTARTLNVIDGHTGVSSVITARPDATSPIGASGITPLHFACQAGAQDVVDYIYQRWLDGQHRGASKKGQRPPALPVDEHGATPLAYAIQGGHTDLVRHLIAPTAPTSTDASSTDGVDGNAEAAATQNEPGLGWAISMAKHSGSRRATLLSLAMSAGWVDIARLLIAEVKRRDKRKLKTFVTQRAADGTQLLHSACYFGSVECVDLLLSLRDDVTGEPLIDADGPDSDGVPPIFYASLSSAACIARLLEEGAPPTVNSGKTVLHMCANTGNVPAVEMLLQGWKENKWGLRDKLDLNAEDPNAAGSTPLHAAIFSTSALAHKNVAALLDAGVDPKKRLHNDDGSLLLHAARSGTAKAVEELLLRNFDVEEADSFGSTPLTAALARQYPTLATSGQQVLLRLLEAGAKVKWGATPLVDVECYINTGSPEENMKSGHTATYYDAGRSAYQVVVGGHFNGVHPPGIYFLSTHYRAWDATYFDNNVFVNRRGHTCTLVGDTIVLFGGLRYAPLPRTHFNDVYFISAVNGRVTKPLILGEAPLARESHTATLVGRKIYFMYGCSATAFMDDIVVLDMDSLEWSRPSVTSLKRPSMRFGHTATLVNDHEIWLYGGINRVVNVAGRTHLVSTDPDWHVFDTHTLQWRTINASVAVPASGKGSPAKLPTPRANHTATLVGEEIYVFGGDASQEINELWIFNTRTHVWRQQEVIKDFSGTGLTGHTCELVDGNKLIIYGGETGVIVRDNVACIETGVLSPASADMAKVWSEREETGDVEFVLPSGQTVAAHRVVLASLSHYFRDLFARQPPSALRKGSGEKLQVRLENEVRREHLEIVLRFIYTDVIDVDNTPGFPPSGTHCAAPPFVRDLIDAAKLYAAERLGQFVARLLRQSMPFHRDTADYEPRSLLAFLNNIEYSDVRLVCEGKIINAHKAILSRCPYFDAMLRMSSSSFFGSENDESEDDVEELVITDTSHDILQVILRYLYELADENPVGEGAFVTEETAVEVLITAEKYGLDTLKLWCEKLIVEVMEEQNIPYFLQLGDTYHAPHLRRYCLSALSAQYDHIDAVLRAAPGSAGGVEEQIESDELRAEVLGIVHERRRKRNALLADYEDVNDKVYFNTVLPTLADSRQPLGRASAVFGVMVGVAAAWAFLGGI